MSVAIIKTGRYTVDPLYQWDLNQVLEIRGLSLPSIPEIHFTNDAMDRAIVKQASMDDAGVITVDVPNSLLQKPHTIKAYVCIYEGETFRSLYLITVPVKARKRPADYTLESTDGEVYSFKAMENRIENLASLIAVHNGVDEELIQKYVNLGADLERKYNETAKHVTDTLEGYSETLDGFSTDLGHLKNYVTPQMFGAKGDGVTDDSVAFINALATGKVLYIPKGEYYCPGDIVLPIDAKIVGNHSTLIDCVLCMNTGVSVEDLTITGSGYVAIIGEKSGQSLTAISLKSLNIDTSAETAILFETGGTKSYYIYNVNIDDVRIDGSVNYGIRFKNDYNEKSIHPWITCVNISNVYMEQFKTAILFDYVTSDGYSFDDNPPIVTNSLMNFTNVKGQWVDRSEHFVDCRFTMSNVHFIDSYPVDYRGADNKRMFQFFSRRFENTDLYVSNVGIDGVNFWTPTLYNEVEIVNSVNKVYDYVAMFCTVKDPISSSRLLMENPYIETSHLKSNAAVIRPISTDNWKEQNIARAYGLGVKLLVNETQGGDAPIIGGNILGFPIVDSDKGTHLILSGRYMPIFYKDHVNYTLPDNPCIGYMVFNTITNKPMWWNGTNWYYADGSQVPADDIT